MKVNRFCEHIFFSEPFVILYATFPRYKVGETFLHLSHAHAIKRLEKDQAAINSQVSSFTSSAGVCEKKMKELKITLYAKFGRAINLDD